MKTKIVHFISGILATVFAVILYNYHAPETISINEYVDSYSTNEETGASSRIMEADVVYFDTDGDGEEENILLYSCQGCNAPPREMAIIDDGELTFFYEGGELQFIPIKAGTFTINETNVPRDGRRIETEYLYDVNSNSYLEVSK